jgi:hypothetical protein
LFAQVVYRLKHSEFTLGIVMDFGDHKAKKHERILAPIKGSRNREFDSRNIVTHHPGDAKLFVDGMRIQRARALAYFAGAAYYPRADRPVVTLQHISRSTYGGTTCG